MTEKYQVKKKNSGKRDYWIVVTERGFIANGKEHPSEKEAVIHCRNCNAFCR